MCNRQELCLYSGSKWCVDIFVTYSYISAEDGWRRANSRLALQALAEIARCESEGYLVVYTDGSAEGVIGVRWGGGGGATIPKDGNELPIFPHIYDKQ